MSENAAKKIKDLLGRREFLQHNIDCANRILGHVNLAYKISAWTKSGDRIDVFADTSFVKGAIDRQLSSDEAALEAIDKKLEAIALVMTM